MLVRREGSCFFFQDMVSSVHTHFEVLFGGGSEGDETGEEGEEETNKGTGDVFQQFGLIPLILRVAECSNSALDTVMSWPVCQTFYIASYIITKNRYEEQQIKQMQMKNKR